MNKSQRILLYFQFFVEDCCRNKSGKQKKKKKKGKVMTETNCWVRMEEKRMKPLIRVVIDVLVVLVVVVLVVLVVGGHPNLKQTFDVLKL